MNEKDYQYTLTIAKCQSFSRAAELLYISQPALSRYIATLEKDLGVTLFDRSTAPIKLTSAGEKFCSYAGTILQMENTLRHEMREIAVSSGMPIKIGVPHVAGEYILSRILPRMMRNHPHIQLDPIQDFTGNLHQRLAAHQIDVAVVCAPDSDASIRSQLLCHEDVYLVGRRDHPALAAYDTASADLEHPLALDLSALSGVLLIHCKPIAVMSYLAEETLGRARFRPESQVKASSLPLALDLTVKGVGFTSVMRCQIRYGHPDTTRMLCPIRLENCRVPFYLAYNQLARHTIPDLDLFVKEALEEYQDATHL